MVRVRLRIRGHVQGVCYRASASDEGIERGLSGWVKNEADGSVLAEVEGAREAVEKMVAWCRKGPRWAEVSDVRVEEIAPTNDGTRFRVEY